MSMSLLELTDDTILVCIDSSLRSCVRLACTSKLACAKLQHAAASQGLRLVARDVRQAFQIKKRLRGAFHIGELVLTCKTWPFWPDWTLTVDLFGHFDKLHTVLVNSEHADEVTELYTLYNQDFNEFSQAKKDASPLTALRKCEPAHRAIVSSASGLALQVGGMVFPGAKFNSVMAIY